ncbi:NADH-quinone oxidoreductase subunit L [Roseibacillus ishigakijimensis]|uniref:NADH-quinone oxidoreductase subunit L n=1 Tax=Roseibacillus ishigakijimensis TaxID=454146 RepID=A0A934VK71_9BACT|nr:NADH-quinone oxidoreductase subunit L [Roseibacillus ishigakijimensis]MBK1833344.1 NADH-quinone oxidoreductase subunit L [Roseibacillus ishigakijimensis]
MHLAWFLLLLPLLSAAAIHLGLKKNAFISSLVSTGSAVATLILTLLFLGKEANPHFAWASFGDFHVNIGLLLDPLSTKMMLVVTGVGTLVHVFSLAYMAKDESKARYFCGLSLFMFSMTGIVLADNFLMMFIFWELVGLSSYLLIGHWFTKESAADAAKKAFCVNRIGDWGFMVGILMLWGITGTLTFGEMELPTGLSAGILGAALLCVFCGAIGKSAQAPLHVWLPDAMEGPTPVSALIHAATMVAAGVYMMARVFISVGFEGFPQWSTDTIAYLGGFTSLIAALMATQQSDIKKILAYSTLSQLGYMVLMLGIAHGHSTEGAMFHLYTHAWFKALLFLGSGAVIYACHHEQNIWKMGGLFKKMPITAITFALGTLALAGFPFTAGFFSKEQILHETWLENKVLFGLVAAVAAMTTFYMGRLFIVVFLGEARDKHSEEAKEVGPLMFVPLVILAVPSVFAGYPEIAKLFSPAYYAPKHLIELGVPLGASVAAFLLGAAAAFVFYFNKKSDPLANNPVSKLFANRFYVDEGYGYVVKYAINVKAAVIEFLDEFLINGLLVGGLVRCSAVLGQLFNRAQSGSLQTYSLLMGVGVVLVIFLTVFVK